MENSNIGICRLKAPTTYGNDGASDEGLVKHGYTRKGWVDLVKEFRRCGYFVPNTMRIVAELVFHVTLLVSGMLLFLCFESSIWIGLLGIVVSASGALGVTSNTHGSSHGGTCRNVLANRGLTFFGFPFMIGVSATYWWHKHCAVHHANPNIVGVDDDLDFMPFFALHSEDIKRSGQLARFYYRHQWLVVPFAISLNMLNIQRQGWAFLIRRLVRPSGTRVPGWIDLACMLAHFGIFLGIPMLLFSPGTALVFYTLRSFVLSYGFFAFVAPAHFPEEAVCAKSQPSSIDFVVRQTLTTANFRLGPIPAFFASGLEFQIEHHLFPQIAPTHYRAMSREVRTFCEAHGLPYHQLGWGEALRKSFTPFYRPKQVLTTLVPAKPIKRLHSDSEGRSATGGAR